MYKNLYILQTSARSPVPTPEPTPESSPVPSPKRAVSPPAVPEASPPVSQKETLHEQAAAYIDESTEEDVTLPPMPAPTEGDTWKIFLDF